jgi:hypothetical protein
MREDHQVSQRLWAVSIRIKMMTRMEGKVIKAKIRLLKLAKQLGIKAALSVAEHCDPHLPRVGHYRLATNPVAPVIVSLSCISLQMMIHLSIQNKLSQRLVQGVKQTATHKSVFDISLRQ